MNRLARLRSAAEQHRLTAAIGLVIVIAVSMTAISLSLYVSSGTLQLDLSRPGYEAARKDIINPEDTSDFAPNGPVNAKALAEYQRLFDAQRKEMNSISSFKDRGLDDASLSFSTNATANNN